MSPTSTKDQKLKTPNSTQQSLGDDHLILRGGGLADLVGSEYLFSKICESKNLHDLHYFQLIIYFHFTVQQNLAASIFIYLFTRRWRPAYLFPNFSRLRYLFTKSASPPPIRITVFPKSA